MSPITGVHITEGGRTFQETTVVRENGEKETVWIETTAPKNYFHQRLVVVYLTVGIISLSLTAYFAFKNIKKSS